MVIKQKNRKKHTNEQHIGIFRITPPYIEAWIKANVKPTANPISFLEYSGTTITGLKKDPNLN